MRQEMAMPQTVLSPVTHEVKIRLNMNAALARTLVSIFCPMA